MDLAEINSAFFLILNINLLVTADSTSNDNEKYIIAICTTTILISQ